MQIYHWMRLHLSHRTDQSLGDISRDIKAVDPYQISFLHLSGVTDKLSGELVNAWVVHS